MLGPGVRSTGVNSALSVKEVSKGRGRRKRNLKPASFVRAADDRIEGLASVIDLFFKVLCEFCFGDSSFRGDDKGCVVRKTKPVIVCGRSIRVVVVRSHTRESGIVEGGGTLRPGGVEATGGGWEVAGICGREG